jgi:uncharacterized protein YdaL
MLTIKQLPQSSVTSAAYSKILLIISLFFTLTYSSVTLAAPKQILILHDSTGKTGFQGREFAIMLRNLLGHFDTNTTILPAKSYVPGTIDQKDVTFYIGSSYGELGNLSTQQEKDNYEAFIGDAAKTTKTVAWMNYNLNEMVKKWKPEWGASTFNEKMGYPRTVIKAREHNFNRVEYKGVELGKGVISWVNPGANLAGCIAESEHGYACSRELNSISISNSDKAQTKATTYSTLIEGSVKEPYITRSNNFWFFGDIPLSHISETDRYLALADLLHDIVDSGIPDQKPTRAMVRLEDVSAGIDTDSLELVMSYLKTEKVPFSIAAVPVYKDPNCVKSLSQPATIKLANSSVANTIKPYYDEGWVSIIAHGYTHQSGNIKNPYNGLTGDDFEFYRVNLNDDNSLTYDADGIPKDSKETWARDRMTQTKQELDTAGFKAFAWEAPHYFAAEEDYLGIKEVYPTHYGRMIYTNNEGPKGRFVGQFFPYVIYSDYYGYLQIPENIGNIEPKPFLGYRPLLAKDLIHHAEKLKVVRDGIASFFYHPFLETDYLNTVVKGFKGLGYDFIKPCSLGTCPDITPSKNFAIPRATTDNTEIEHGECPVGTQKSGGGNTGLTWLLALFGILLTRKQINNLIRQ